MSRSNVYDNVPAQLKSLAGLIGSKNNLLRKSKDEDTFSENIQEVVVCHKAAGQVGSELYNSFVELKADYNTEKINQAKYVAGLKQFKEFFDITDLELLDVPESLKAREILEEIARFI